MTFSIVTSFAGVVHGAGTEITAIVPDTADFSLSVDLELIARGERPPLTGGRTWRPRAFDVEILRPTGASLSGDAWWNYVAGLYSPLLPARTLQVSHGGVTLETEVEVETHSLVGPQHGRARLVQTDPVWRAATPTTVSASPYTPGGNHPAQPVITLTKAATGKMREITITDTTGRGMSGVLVVIGGGGATEGGTLDLSGVSAASVNDYLVFDNSRPDRFFLLNPGNATTAKLAVAPSLRADEAKVLKLVYGSGINNTITAQAIKLHGRNLSHADYGNDKWVYLGAEATIGGQTVPPLWAVSSAPNAPGVWRAGRLHQHPAGEAFSIAEDDDNVKIAWATGQGNVVADAMILETQVKVTEIQGLGISMNTDPGAIEGGFIIFPPPVYSGGTAYEDGVVRYLPLDAITYQVSVNPTPTSGSLSAFPTPDAIAVAVTTLLNRLNTVTQQDTGTPVPIAALVDTGEIPTVSIGAAVDIVHWNVTIENETLGQSIEITDVFTTATSLVIDCRTGEITPSDLLFQHDEDALNFNQRLATFTLQNGIANTITVTGTGVTWSMDVPDALVL